MVKRIVVKVGTSSIVRKDDMGLDEEKLDRIVDDLASVKSSGRDVILVTSGAIGAGAGKLGLRSRPRDIPTQQAAAAIGQSLLMNAYERSFSRHGITVGQMLLTRDDFSDRRRYTNISNTLIALLRYGVVPIINENDTVAVEEIKVGDNDMLSAFTTLLARADLLVILSDIDGLYTADPRKEPNAKLVDVVEEITDELRAFAGGKGGELGTGGMDTKLAAAEVVIGSGEMMVIANSSIQMPVTRLLKGERIGTLFLPRKKGRKLPGRKRWIAYSPRMKGAVRVDRGAYEALVRKGASLLASGIISVEGKFDFGDTIRCLDEKGREFARGLTNYSSEEIKKIMGHKTSEIELILGYRYYDEVIHRDNLVILKPLP
ncbi:glutamate 5-kinase [Candidatus Poribacteria bacterium]|nr:glutamate 5-kinase [Candidatus Poribacteria bacterium]